MGIQNDALRRDPLECYPIGQRHAVDRVLVSPIHPMPGFFVEGRVRSQDHLYLSSRLLCPLSPV